MDSRSIRRQVIQLNEQLLAQTSVDDQKRLIVEVVARLVPGQVVLWLDRELHRLPRGSFDDDRTLSFDPPSALMRRAIETGEVSLLSSLRKEVRGSAVAVPLLAQDRGLGALEVRRPEGPPFHDDEIALVEDLALQAATALQSAQRMAIEQWRIEQLSLVRRVSAQVANVLDLDELARQVTTLVLDAFRYYYVAFFTLEPGQDVLRYRAGAGPYCSEPDQCQDSPFLRVRLGEGLVGRVAQTGVEILANDVSSEPFYRYVSALPETQSEVVLPLKIEGRVLGVLDVQSDQLDAFRETDLLVLRALADNIAIAVEGARLYGDLRRRADQLSTVAEVSRAVASILDTETLLDRVVNLIHEQFAYPFVHLLTVDPVREQVVYQAGSGPRGRELREEGLVCGLDDSEGIVPWVVRHGETLLVNSIGDTGDDVRYRPSRFSELEARSELAVPLTFGGEVLGVLDVQSDRRNAFTDDDRFLCGALADSIAIAIRNANLYRSERWRRQVAESMREVAGLLSADVDLEQELDAILIELYQTLPSDVAAIWLLQDETLCLSAVQGRAVEMCVGDDLSSTDDSWLSEALQADQPIIRTPQSLPDPLGVAMGFPSDYSAIAAPLRVGDRSLGVLTLIHRSPERYGAESRLLTAAFASYAAVAIENTRLYQETQELARISTAMLQVAEATQPLTTLDQVLETVTYLVPNLVGVERCAVFLWDDFRSVFVPSAASGLSSAQQAIFEQWVVAAGDESAFEDLRLNKSPVFIYDVATDSRLSDLVAWDLGFESLLLLPLLAQDDVFGAMLVDYRSDWSELDVVGLYRDERLVTIQGVALQAATAVENIRLREAQQEEAYVSAALLQVAQAVANLTDLDEILSTIVRLVPLLVGGERCVIYLWDEESAIFCPAQAYGISDKAEDVLMNQRYGPGDFYLLDAVREQMGRAFRSVDVRSDVAEVGGKTTPDEWVPSGFAEGFTAVDGIEDAPLSLLALPLSVKGDLLGVMVLEETPVSGQLGHKTRTKRLEIIEGIAHQAALAIQNDLLHQETAERERLERELQLAHDIQQAFMPSEWFDIPGWDLAFAWRAARQVAGDFYDFFELPERRLGIVIADVADKGMPAALFMALTRTLVRAAALEETSPAAVMARVNDLLVPDAQSGMFVTAIYAVLKLDTGRLVYANAGHNLPLLKRVCSGEVESFEKGGMALGILEGVRVTEHVVSLEPGDCLVFYTDGVTEAFSPEGEIYGADRLRMVVQSPNACSAQALLDAVDESVVDFIGDTAPSDDRTLMALCRT